MNNYYVTTRGQLSADKIDAFIREIVAAKWGTNVRVDRDGKNWEVRAVGHREMGVSIRFKNRCKLEFGETGGLMLSEWFQAHLQSSLAQRLGGWCSSEDGPAKWEGNPAKYPTFEAWLTWYHHNLPPVSLRKAVSQILANTPKVFHV